MIDKPQLPVPVNPPLTTRVCDECERRFPLQEFIVSSDGSTRCLCPGCHEREPAKEAARHEASQKAEEFRQLLQSIGKISAPTISQFVAALAEKYNGVDGLAQFFHDQIDAAASTDKGRGSTRVLQACGTIGKLIIASTAYQASLTEVGEMSDADLAEEWDRSLAAYVRGLSAAELRRLAEEAERDEHTDSQSA